MELRQIFQAAIIKGLKTFAKFFGVIVAHFEHDARARLRHHGAGDLWLTL